MCWTSRGTFWTYSTVEFSLQMVQIACVLGNHSFWMVFVRWCWSQAGWVWVCDCYSLFGNICLPVLLFFSGLGTFLWLNRDALVSVRICEFLSQMTRLIQYLQTVNITSYKQFKFLIYYLWGMEVLKSQVSYNLNPRHQTQVVKIDQSTFIQWVILTPKPGLKGDPELQKSPESAEHQLTSTHSHFSPSCFPLWPP